jgi:hypothetical protein
MVLLCKRNEHKLLTKMFVLQVPTASAGNMGPGSIRIIFLPKILIKSIAKSTKRLISMAYKLPCPAGKF